MLRVAQGDVPAEPAQRLPVLRAHVSSAGVDPTFLDQPDYGIPASFGRVKFAFNEDVSALRTVLAAVDQFVTLADGPLPSPFMRYSLFGRKCEFPRNLRTGPISPRG